VLKKDANRYHAVAIVPGEHACPAAKDLSGKRFLSREAPILPLADCSSAECSCTYSHFGDRRTGSRRTSDLVMSMDTYAGGDRRRSERQGRRKTDR
jgi:hypothetical protein